MPETNQLQHCDHCGAVLSGYGAERLCAACLLESAIVEANAPPGAPAAAPPLLAFTDYELLEEVARGGMGVVYRARQISLNRPVAIKLMLAGHLANAAEVQRFRTEAETAAQLHHPNIVAIHEVGEHEGQPFFSMELVAGRSLAQVVRDEPLSSRKAAAYLKSIAEAVQYAHSRGVLHRDLKPSNILIDEHDRPRIADFGLAKRFNDSPMSTSDPQLTQTGQVLGSPSFIPPEQAAGERDKVGPASDVYSLGAILYHCLTARPPFVSETLTQTLRMVAEQEPVAPRLLNAGVPRDLETICLKCLEKSPQRRYASAQELADELRLFCEDKPIRARPMSLVGKSHRWCLRNKPLAASGTAILALLLAVAVGSPVAAFRINRERLQAQASQQKAEEFARFLSQTLASAGPSVAQGRDKTLLLEILSNATWRVSHELKNQPEVEADVRLVIGSTYIDLGDYTNALAMTREALRLREAHFGPRNISVARALNNLGAILAEMGDLPGAEAYDRRALELKIALLGRENPDVATSMSNLGFRLQSQGKLAEAEPLLREALRIRLKMLPPSHPDTAMSLNNLAMLLWARGQFDEAESQFRRALAIFQNLYPKDHPMVATMLNNVGEVLRNLGRLGEAEATMRDAVAMRERVLGHRSAYTAYSQHNLAIILERLGRLDEAEKHHREAVLIFCESLGTNHPWMAEALCAQAILVGRKGDLAGAETMQRDSLATAERTLGTNNPGTTEPLERLATIMAVQTNFVDAVALFAQALIILKQSAGPEHPDLIPALCHLGWVRQQEGNSAAAEALYQEAATISRKGGNYSLRVLTDSYYDLADLLQAQNRFSEAEPLLLESSACLTRRPENAALFERVCFERLVQFYESWDRAVPHSGKDREAFTWRKKLAECKARAAQNRV
jgi:tetratricopeptide (TPR) repeat protein